MITDQTELAKTQALTPPGKCTPPGYKLSLEAVRGLNDGHWAMWLRSDMTPRETAITVLHELAHLKCRIDRKASGDIGSQQRADEEVDVEAWAQARHIAYQTSATTWSS